MDLLPIYLLAALIDLDGIELLVLLNQGIGLGIGHLLEVIHQ